MTFTTTVLSMAAGETSPSRTFRLLVRLVGAAVGVAGAGAGVGAGEAAGVGVGSVAPVVSLIGLRLLHRLSGFDLPLAQERRYAGHVALDLAEAGVGVELAGHMLETEV